MTMPVDSVLDCLLIPEGKTQKIPLLTELTHQSEVQMVFISFWEASNFVLEVSYDFDCGIFVIYSKK